MFAIVFLLLTVLLIVLVAQHRTDRSARAYQPVYVRADQRRRR